MIQSMYELGIVPVFWTEDEPGALAVEEPATEGPAAMPSDLDEMVEMLSWV